MGYHHYVNRKEPNFEEDKVSVIYESCGEIHVCVCFLLWVHFNLSCNRKINNMQMLYFDFVKKLHLKFKLQ